MTLELGKKTLSPTALGNYLQCGRKGQYYQNPDLPRATTLGLAKGSAFHWALETFNRGRMYYGDDAIADRDTADLVARLGHIAHGYLIEQSRRDDFIAQPDDDINQAIADLDMMLATWASDPSNQWMDSTVQLLGFEVRVDADFGSDSHNMVGYIDGVYQVDEVGVVGCDFKTAGKAWGGDKAAGDPRKLIQAPLYAEAWYQQTGIDMDWFVYDVFTIKGRFQRVWVKVDQESRKPFITRWLETANTVELHWQAGLELPTNPESFLCSQKWCGFWDICPMGASLTKLLDTNSK